MSFALASAICGWLALLVVNAALVGVTVAGVLAWRRDGIWEALFCAVMALFVVLAIDHVAFKLAASG